MAEILKELTKYPVSTRLSLNGTIIVGRDIAHAKLKERLDRGEDLPQYIKDHPIYYAGPAKTPAGIGGPAAILAQNNIKSIECVEYPELGMEAIWKIEVEDFPAFILVDDKGNDFFKQIKPRCAK